MDTTHWFLYILTLHVIVSSLEAGKHQFAEILLSKDLKEKYSKIGGMGRPVLNASDPIYVSFSPTVISIFKLDAKSQSMQFSAWRRIKWQDDLLTWNPEEYDGIKSIVIPSSEIWTPDIMLYNQHAKTEFLSEKSAIVYHNGSVGMKIATLEESWCSVDITNFPHDEQTCEIQYGPFEYRPHEMHIEMDQHSSGLAQYERTLDNNEWDVIGAELGDITRDLGVGGFEPYEKAVFLLKMRRRPEFYNFVLVNPSALIAPLTLLIFLMPSNNADRNSYAAAIFPAYPVLLLIIAEVCPPGMKTIPKVGQFLITNMFLLVLAVFLSSIVVVRLYDISDKEKMPRLVEKMLHGWLGCLCCLPHRKSSIAAGEDKTQKEENHPMGQGEANEERRSWKLLSKLLDRILLISYLIVEIVLYAKYISF